MAGCANDAIHCVRHILSIGVSRDFRLQAVLQSSAVCYGFVCRPHRGCCVKTDKRPQRAETVDRSPAGSDSGADATQGLHATLIRISCSTKSGIARLHDVIRQSIAWASDSRVASAMCVPEVVMFPEWGRKLRRGVDFGHEPDSDSNYLRAWRMLLHLQKRRRREQVGLVQFHGRSVGRA